MTTLRLVLHAKQAQNPQVRTAVAALRASGHRIEVRPTWEAGDAGRLADEARRLGIERVVAGGGDGTINEVAGGLLAAAGSEVAPALAIVPLGTANDFAHACRIPLDAEAALQLAARVEPRPIDVGRAGGRPFINVATGGFGTEITVETRPELKKFLEASFSGPDFSWAGRLLVLAVGNGRQAGGGHVLCPEAMLDDGLLDVSILPEPPPGERAEALRDLLREGKKALWRLAVSARLPWLQLEAPKPLQVNLDGEPISGASLRFEVLQGALRACLPEDAPVIRRSR